MKSAFRLSIAALTLGFLLQGATLERLSLEDMVRRSSAIVRARVSGSYAAAHGNIIYTHYRLQVVDGWKGISSGEVEVVLPGGVAAGLRQSFPGTPKLNPGSEYVVFLWRGPSGLTHVIGLSQGLFELRRGANGEMVAHRGPVSAVLLNAAGRPVRDSAMTLRLSDLRQKVLAAGGAGVAR